MSFTESGKNMMRTSLREAAVKAECLVSGCDFRVANHTVFDNIGSYREGFAKHMREDIYTDRRAILDPISLYAFDNMKIVPQLQFLAISNGHIIEETIAPAGISENELSKAVEMAADVQVTEEILVVARYGALTWGHWIGELLPKIVICEWCAPSLTGHVAG